ncbi:MAG: J domain-containing protein [Anaerolineales bacterium]|nr:J domain-containing protein [Anaerolineales bacterium]
MDFKDYYASLGVAPEADPKAIKQAFRQLARQHHPDMNPGNQAAEEKFKAINEAYQVLTDPEQRKKYDTLRVQYQHWQQAGHPQQDFDWQTWAPEPGQSARSYATPEDLADLFGNAMPNSEFFARIFGQPRARGASRRQDTRPRRGRDIETEAALTLAEAFQGAARQLELDGRRLTASLPPGVRTGSRVRLTGLGEPGQNGGPAGDLYLIVQILPDAVFERQGDDLHLDVPVDIFTAIAGGETDVPTLERRLALKIPPRTNAGQSFRLRGKGMPHLGDPRQRGDLFARVKLVLPDPLTAQEVERIRELAAARVAQPQPSR